MDASKINQHALDALCVSLFNSWLSASERRNYRIATALKELQDKNKKRLDDRRKAKASSKPTCADCSHQDENKAAIGAIRLTYCLKKNTHVGLDGDTCDDFIAKPKTLQEKPKNLAETVADLYAKNADLESQKKALKSANKELKDLVSNCPTCDSLRKDGINLRRELLAESGSLINELRKHNTSLVNEKERLLDEILGLCLASEKESEVIANLQRRLTAEVKENETLRKGNTFCIKAMPSDDCPACATHLRVIDDLESILDKRDTRNDESEKAITKLTKQVEELIARNNYLEQITDKKEASITKQEGVIEHLQAVIDAHKNVQADLIKKIDELSTNAAQNAARRDQAKDMFMKTFRLDTFQPMSAAEYMAATNEFWSAMRAR